MKYLLILDDGIKESDLEFIEGDDKLAVLKCKKGIRTNLQYIDGDKIFISVNRITQ